jgi:hypothetical protein
VTTALTSDAVAQVEATVASVLEAVCSGVASNVIGTGRSTGRIDLIHTHVGARTTAQTEDAVVERTVVRLKGIEAVTVVVNVARATTVLNTHGVRSEALAGRAIRALGVHDVAGRANRRSVTTVARVTAEAVLAVTALTVEVFITGLTVRGRRLQVDLNGVRATLRV